MDTYRYLEPWARPSHYIGPSWTGWYPVYGQHRDSDVIERSNFAVLREMLDGLAIDVGEEWCDADDVPAVLVVRDGHFLVGWIETLYVHGSARETLRAADDALARLDAYPILDEWDLAERELDDAGEAWDSWARADYMDLLRDEFADDLMDGLGIDVDWFNGDADAADELARATMDGAGIYWEHGSGGPYLDVERLAGATSFDGFLSAFHAELIGLCTVPFLPVRSDDLTRERLGQFSVFTH